jgi:hypothetical protein
MRQHIDDIKNLALQKSTDQQQISRLFQNINTHYALDMMPIKS